MAPRPPAHPGDRIRGFLFTTERHTAHRTRSWAEARHARDELVWSTSGVMRVAAGDQLWTVPAHRAVWLPAGQPHAIEVSADTVLHATYFARGAAPQLPRGPVVVELLPAVRELLLLNTASPLPPATRMRLQELAIELLVPAPTAQVDLRMPETPRLRHVAEGVLADLAAADSTAAWADRVGLPARELSRAFAAETGLSVTQWRIRARVRASLVPLGSGQPVVATARTLGYASASTFIAHFRSVLGVTPAAYFAPGGDKKHHNVAT